MDELLVRLGRRIRELRSQKGWSQEEFASICKVHRTYMEHLERGEKSVSFSSLVRAAFALGGPDSNFDASLYSNSGGVPGTPDAVVGSGTAPAYGGGPNLITLGTPIDLTAGVEYWLVLAPADSGTSLAWEIGGKSIGPMAVSFNAPFPHPMVPFSSKSEEHLSATPEPVVSWFLAAAFCAAAIIFRRW